MWRIDSLTLEDWINMHVELDGLTFEELMKKSLAAAYFYEFVSNILHLRIAVGKYEGLTGYTISEESKKSE